MASGHFTYIPTGHGWLYLAAVKDMATREIVGWSMSDGLEAGSACEALRMAIQQHQPPAGLIHHTDSKYLPSQRCWSA